MKSFHHHQDSIYHHQDSFHHHQEPSENASLRTSSTLEHHEDKAAIKLALQKRIGMKTEKPQKVNMLLHVLSKVDRRFSKRD